MATFRIVALRILEGCPQHYRKVLDEKKTYFFDERYKDVEGADFIQKVSEDSSDIRLYDVEGYNGRKISIEISAVVGRNGEGKSTLIELIIRVLNNFACTQGFKSSQETLRQVKDLRAALFYEIDDIIYCIRCDEQGTKWYSGIEEIKMSYSSDGAKINELKKNHHEQLFYTLVMNYALYSYNSNWFAHETEGDGCWLDGLFHKNDSYQTPLVLNPMRTNGNIDVNKELYLSRQRLMAVFTDAGEDREKRLVSDGVEAHGFAFSIDEQTKLLDVTLSKYFNHVADDECRIEELEVSDPKEGAREMMENFHQFFKSLNELLDKNDYLTQWLIDYGKEHPQRHSQTDLAKYVDIIVAAYEEEPDYHSYNIVLELGLFTQGRPLRWMNYAQLYRLLLLLAVWEVLREIKVIKLKESLDNYLSNKEEPTSKAILYLPYKILEILSTYDPYKKSRYLYDGSCEAMYSDWPTGEIKRKLKENITSILNKDDYTSLKLHQTINYLKEQKGGMFGAEKMDQTREEYEWFVSFDKLKEVIYKENMTLSDLVKKLPPPVFKGEIELLNEKKSRYALSTLSSGQIQRLNSAGALVYHLRNLDYRLNQHERLEYDYVTVIFEEVELYFHPDFQRTLVDYFLTQIERTKLKNIKGIQLIYVTHSPFILTDLLERNVMYLSKDVKQRPGKSTFAANIYDLLDDHFYLTETIGDVALRQLQKIITLYNDDNNSHRDQFCELEPFFDKLKDQIADDYLKEDYTRMYYELLAKYMHEKLNDELAKAKQRVIELTDWANKGDKLQ